MAKKRTISACLIVRDEEANLPRCLASLKGIADQIVVVDTGSADRTVEIAEAAGAEVHHFAWCDDFSAARNESLRHATGDFILWVDADDELVERTPGALRRLCAGPAASWGCWIEVRCPGVSPDEAVPVVRQWRLFPRAAGVRFEGRVHEHPVAPRVIDPQDVLAQDQAHVVHWGYTAGGEVAARKLQRNRKLIELSIQEDPRQPRHYFNLGSQLLAENNPAQALPALVESINRWFQAHGADTGYVPAMFAAAARAAVDAGQPQAALEIEARTPPEFVSSDLLFQAGIACRQLGRPGAAALRWRQAASDPAAIANILADRDCVQRAQAELQALQAAGEADAVSACLIVKNEEEDLPRVLASIRDLVDEIVVVDTGSTDRTVEIARSFGARTFFFEWCDDFSAARNVSLKHALGDFVLWVDADDELLPGRPDAVRALCREMPTGAWAYWVDVFCPADEWHESETIVKQPRLFRRGPGSAFAGRLHEQLGPPAGFAPEALAFQGGVAIRHWGYIPNAGTSERRSERNRKLLELEIERYPDEHFHYYNLGLQFAGDKQFADGLRTFERAIELWRRQQSEHDGHVASMFAMAALCAVEAKEYQRALAIESGAPVEYVSADLLYHAGLAWWGLDDAAQALARFRRVLEDPSLRDHNAHDHSTSSWRPLIMMAAIYSEQQAWQAACDAARTALNYALTRPDALYLAAHAEYQLGRTADALAVCREALAGKRDDGFKPKLRRLLLNLANDLDDDALALEALAGEIEDVKPAAVQYLLARVSERQGDANRQRMLLVDGLAQYPDNPDLRLALSQLLEDEGRETEAMTVLADAMDYPPVAPAVYQRLALLLARRGRMEDAANALQLAASAAAAPAPELVAT
jgi:glycosyltransferase involved in cell wall biosynthesis